jgi:hypothetical protein
MMAASSQPVRANFSYGHTYETHTFETHEGGSKKKSVGYQFWKVWHSVHRGRSM